MGCEVLQIFLHYPINNHYQEYNSGTTIATQCEIFVFIEDKPGRKQFSILRDVKQWYFHLRSFFCIKNAMPQTPCSLLNIHLA